VKRIPVAGPWITSREIDYVADAVTNGWYENANGYPDRFERAFADCMGAEHAVALPSCTSGIHLSLAAFGVGPGDEVIVPEVTWIASAAPVTYVGATPVFADVDASTWCLSADSFEQAITPRTRAVIPVDLYGNIPDMAVIRSVASKHGIAIIEDAAQAIGSRYEGRLSGTLGDVGVFSFHGTKTLTTGEGGMLVTDRSDVYERVLTLRDHGCTAGRQEPVEVGFEYRMSAPQAAMGLAQLERLDELVWRKRDIFGWYREALRGTEGLTLNYEPPGVFSTYWMVTIVAEPRMGIEKNAIIEGLSRQRIDCRPIFSPLSSLPAYEGHPLGASARAKNRVSYALGPYGVNLPSGFNLDEETVRFVASKVKEFVSNVRRAA
jgi:perosamine synthetase